MDTPESPKTHTENDLQPDAQLPDRGKPARTVAQSSKIPQTKKRGRPKIDYPASIKPSIGDIREAAGFYEGEGSVGPSISLVIGQNDREKLDWLQARFGGIIDGPRVGKPKGNLSYRFRMNQARATGFLFTIYTFLSKSRKQQFRDRLEGKKSKREYELAFGEVASEKYIKAKLEALIKKANKKRRGPLSLFGAGK